MLFNKSCSKYIVDSKLRIVADLCAHMNMTLDFYFMSMTFLFKTSASKPGIISIHCSQSELSVDLSFYNPANCYFLPIIWGLNEVFDVLLPLARLEK